MLTRFLEQLKFCSTESPFF
uniref:Uncharacterized protein n=1 Tax=Rhizophora mucronata TaxID=61149 RepID=A0A2P2QQ11_RHIMU